MLFLPMNSNSSQIRLQFPMGLAGHVATILGAKKNRLAVCGAWAVFGASAGAAGGVPMARPAEPGFAGAPIGHHAPVPPRQWNPYGASVFLGASFFGGNGGRFADIASEPRP